MSSENKSVSTVLAIAACALSLAANADTFWKGQGADSDFYNRDNWINWWNANYVFGGGQLGNLPADGSYVTFTNAAAIAQGLWIENANKGGVEWSLVENAEEGAGLTITNSLTIGTGRAGQLTIKGGEYLVRGALNVASGLGTTDGGSGKSTLTLTNCTMTVEDGVFVAYNANGANGEVVVQSNAVLNATNTNGDKFSICKGGNGHNDTKGSLVIDGGVVNVAGPFYTCQEGGTGDVTINGGELNVSSEALFARGWYNGATSTLTMNGGKLWTSGNLEFAAKPNRNGGTGYLCMNAGKIDVDGSAYLGGKNATMTTTMTGGEIEVADQLQLAADTGGTSTFTMTDGSIACGGLFQIGRNATGVFTMDGGETSCNGFRLGTDRSDAVGTATINGGYLHSTSDHFYIGNNGTGLFYMNGGEVYCANQFWLGNGSSSDGTFIMTNGNVRVRSYTCVGYGSGVGHFIMNGGSYYQENEKFIVGQSNSDTAYGECIVSNGTLNVPNLWIAENTKRGTLTMEGGELISRGETQMSRNTNAGKGTIILNGGVLSVFRFVGSSGTGGEVIFNGGTLKALDNRGDFIPDIANCEFKIAAGGAVFDTNGKNVTVADTLGNADGLVGNGTIAKKGLGTLTISSNLDLERTFKFTINNDLGAAGVGTIVLTGSNTLEAGDKITVEIDPVNAETNVAYTVMTGLGELTIADIVLTGTDFYSYTGEVTDGTLSVTLQYGPTAPITARYDNGAWGVYNYNNELIPNGTATNLTTYVFNGGEPAGDLATYASGHKVLLESGTIAIDSAVLAGHVAVADGATVTIDASGAASLVADSLVNNGTLVFNGDITIDAPLSSGTISIAESAALHLTKSQNPSAIFEGMGELMLENITIHVLNTSYFKNFHGTIAIGNNSTLYDDVEFHCENKAGANHAWYGLGENTTIKMAGGSIARFSDRGSNNEYIGNVVIAEGTTNTWSNSSSRGSAWEGVNLELKGTFSGAGTLQAYCGGRHYRFESDLTEFAGTVEMSGSAFGFRYGINGGTWIANPTAVLYDNLSVSNATLVLKGNHEQVLDNNSNVISTGTYTIGADATLKVADDASVEGITFAAGATLELLDDGALSDKTQTYVALTSKTPISGPMPSLVQSEGNRGKWKLVVREIPAETEEGSPTYQLVASFRPKGFVIIIN